MKIRRSIATALVAGTFVLGIGFVAPAAHASGPGPDVIQINPCVLNPDRCPNLPPPPLPRDPETTTTTAPMPTPPKDAVPAPPAVSVKTTVAFTG